MTGADDTCSPGDLQVYCIHPQTKTNHLPLCLYTWDTAEVHTATRTLRKLL